VLADVAGCKASTAIDTATFKALATAISKQSFSKQKVQVVASFVASNLTVGFTGNQTTQLLSLFTFSSDQVAVVQIIRPWSLGITCDDMVAVLGTLSFSNDQLATLEALVDLVIDLGDRNATIINTFAFSSDKAKAALLITNARPVSCVWGDVQFRQHVVFVIDVSGSMSTVMQTPSGAKMSRLAFVVEQLAAVLNVSLGNSQYFNVIAFSAMAAAWQPGVVQKSATSVASAVAFARALTAGGSTNMVDAIDLAMSDARAQGIVLLSDGEPDCCGARMISTAGVWATASNQLNTVLIQSGGAAMPIATKFMCDLATAGRGICRTNN